VHPRSRPCSQPRFLLTFIVNAHLPATPTGRRQRLEDGHSRRAAGSRQAVGRQRAGRQWAGSRQWAVGRQRAGRQRAGSGQEQGAQPAAGTPAWHKRTDVTGNSNGLGRKGPGPTFPTVSAGWRHAKAGRGLANGSSPRNEARRETTARPATPSNPPNPGGIIPRHCSSEQGQPSDPAGRPPET